MGKFDRFLMAVLFVWMGVQFFGLVETEQSVQPGPAPHSIPLERAAALIGPKPNLSLRLSNAGIQDSKSLPASRYTGTGFALSSNGYWATARHVLDGCVKAGAEFETRNGKFNKMPITRWRSVTGTDVAVFDSTLGYAGLPLATQSSTQNDEGYFFGYPKGRANAAYAINIGKVRMVRKRLNEAEAADVWAIYEFKPAKTIQLGGNSGGPVMNRSGEVVGVLSAGNDRRGRVFTSIVPELRSLKDFSSPQFKPELTLNQSNYVAYGEKLRRDGLVMRIDCRT